MQQRQASAVLRRESSGARGRAHTHSDTLYSLLGVSTCQRQTAACGRPAVLLTCREALAEEGDQGARQDAAQAGAQRWSRSSHGLTLRGRQVTVTETRGVSEG